MVDNIQYTDSASISILSVPSKLSATGSLFGISSYTISASFASASISSSYTITASHGVTAVSASFATNYPNLYWANVVVIDLATGNDSTGERGNPNKPFETFTAAENASQAGDTIFVRSGTYAFSSVPRLTLNRNWYLEDGVEMNMYSTQSYCKIDGAAHLTALDLQNVKTGSVIASQINGISVINTNNLGKPYSIKTNHFANGSLLITSSSVDIHTNVSEGIYVSCYNPRTQYASLTSDYHRNGMEIECIDYSTFHWTVDEVANDVMMSYGSLIWTCNRFTGSNYFFESQIYLTKNTWFYSEPDGETFSITGSYTVI